LTDNQLVNQCFNNTVGYWTNNELALYNNWTNETNSRLHNNNNNNDNNWHNNTAGR